VAQAEGLHPATAARDFHIIQGRPALKADAMLARFQNAGGSVQWKDYTDEKVTGTFKHPNGGELDVTWTIEQAIKIGLVKPGSGWQKFPRAMLRSRCISEGIRSVFPGSVTGFYSPEEVADFTPVEKDVTPAVNSISQSASLSKGAFDDMKDDLPFEAPATTGQFALRVPNQDTPYDYFDTKDQWIDGFVDIVRKIYDSSKYTPEEKQAKYEALREVNLMFIKGFDPQTSVKFTRLTSIIRKADHE